VFSELFAHANEPMFANTIVSLLKLDFFKHQGQYGADICPDSMLTALLTDCDALPAQFSNAKCKKIRDYIKQFNKNGTYLVNEMFSKYEAMIVATLSLSSTLRFWLQFCFSSCLFRSSSHTHTVGFRYLSVITGVATRWTLTKTGRWHGHQTG
jgi:hypothetical protein